MKRLLLITALISSSLWCAEQNNNVDSDDIDNETPQTRPDTPPEATKLLEIVKAMPSAKDLALLSPYQRIQEKTSWSRKAVAAQEDKDLFSLFARDAAMKTAASYLIEKGYPDIFKQLYMPEGNFYGKLNELNLIPDNQGKTLLHYAAQSGSLDAIEIVKNFGNQMNIFIIRDHAGQTPLHYAVIHNHVDLIPHLTSARANSQDILENIPLHYAVMNNNLAAVKALSPNVRHVLTANANEETPLSIAQNNNYNEILKLFEEIAPPTAQLRQAIEDGDFNAVQRLMDAGTAVNDLETETYSPLLSAIQKNTPPFSMRADLAHQLQFQHILTLEFLINAGANLHFQDSAGRTLIDYALEQFTHDSTYVQMNIPHIPPGHVLVMPSLKILERLIAAGAPLKKSTDPEILEELLSIGTAYNRPLIAQAALQAGALIYNESFLLEALSTENPELIKILLSYGARITNEHLEHAQGLWVPWQNQAAQQRILHMLRQVRPAAPRLPANLQLRYKGDRKQ